MNNYLKYTFALAAALFWGLCVQAQHQYCPGDTFDLTIPSAMVSSGSTIQWYLNASPIPGANDTLYQATAIGTYTVTTTNGLCSRPGCAPITITNGTCPGSVGNYVWIDTNGNGLQDEPTANGINGVVVELWNATTNTIVGTTITANDGSGNPGYYNFSVAASGDYYIKFPINSGNNVLTTQTATAGTDGNSDADLTGKSPTFTINLNGTGAAKDNMTIDVGYMAPLGCTDLVIDNFTRSNSYINEDDVISPFSYNNFLTNVGSFGGELDVISEGTRSGISTNHILSLSSGRLSINNDAQVATNTVTLVWDGLDNNATTINHTGLGGIDITNGGLRSALTFDFRADFDPGMNDSITIVLDLYTNSGAASRASIKFDGPTSIYTTYTIPFSTLTNLLGGGATLTNIGAISLKIDMTSRASFDAALTNVEFMCAPASGSVGNYVWTDTDGNGLQGVGEVGINGVTVELWSAGPNGVIGGGDDVMIADTLTATNAGADGYYNFLVTASGNYYIHFPTSTNGKTITTQTVTAATDGNSDADPATGNTPVFAMNLAGTGTDVNNPTLDAGFKCDVAAPTTVSNSRCGAGTVVLNASGCTGGTLSWWDASLGGTFLGTGSPFTTPSISGTTNYFVDCTIGACTSTGRTTATATVNPMPASGIDAVPSICATEPTLFQATNPLTGNTYTWDFGTFATPSTSNSSSQTVSFGTGAVGTAQTVSLVVATAAGCSENHSWSINVTPTPFANAGPDTAICQGRAVQIGAAPSGQVTSTYLWTPNLFLNSNSVANPIATPPSTITYTLTTTINGCVRSDQVTVTVDVNLNPVADAGPDQGICTGGSVMIGGAPTSDQAGSFYIWSPAATLDNANIANPTASPTTTTTYQVIVLNQYACPDTDYVVVTVASGSVGNYVWNDTDGNGLQNEGPASGINGVPVELWSTGADGVMGGTGLNADTQVSSTTTSTNAGNPGYYNFVVCESGNYFVHFPSTNGANILTTATITAGTDNNSDASRQTGNSPIFTIDVNGTGTAKDNPTIDAGYYAPATLGDFVWLDTDGDGSQDPGEVGVSGVTVTLYNTSGAVVGTTTTDAYGYYTFTNIAPGTYTVGFGLPSDYTFSGKDLSGGDNNTDSDVNTSGINFGKTDPIVINSGDNITNVDAGVQYVLPVKASLGDYVWFDATPNGIQDVTERGFSGVVVTLLDNSNAPIGTAITNGEGYYFFGNLTPGNYSVAFTLPAGYTFTGQDLGGDDNTDSDVATSGVNFGKTIPTTIVAGENDLSWDAGLVRQATNTASIGNLVWNDIDQDGVQDANEPGIAGVTVTLYDVNGNSVATTTTNELGEYIFSNVTPGTYYITFSTPAGFAFTTPNNSGEDDMDSDANATGTTALFTVRPNDIRTDIDAGLYNTSPTNTAGLGDYVWYDNDGNGIQDLGETGVAGITVILYNAAGVELDRTVTNTTGEYFFPNLAGGTYQVQFTNLPDNYGFSPTGQGTLITGSDADPRGMTAPIILGAGEINRNIDAGILIQPGNGGNGSLGNYVWNDVNQNGLQDANEPGVGNVTVQLLDGTTNAVLQTTRTDAAGYYIFTNLDAALYKVEFVTASIPAGFAFTTANAGADEQADSDADAGTGRTTTIALAQGENRMDVDAGIFNATAPQTSVGNFVWADDGDGVQEIGEPGIPNITVTLYDENGVIVGTTITNEEGAYIFVGMPTGTYTIGFSGLPSGMTFAPQGAGTSTTDSDANTTSGITAPFIVDNGVNQNRTDIDAGLISTRALIGNYVWLDANKNGVQDLGETPVSGVTVTLYSGATPVATAITNAQGEYYFANINPGTYTIGFTTLPSGVSFTGMDLGGNNDADSDVNPATGRTDAFTVAAGDVNLSFDAGLVTPELGSLTGNAWFDADNDGTQDPGEYPTGGVTVILFDLAGNVVATTITDENGNYHFDNITPGDYNVGFTNLPIDPATGLPYAYTTPDVGGNDGIDSDVNPLTGISITPVTVNPGPQTQGPDAGLITPGASVGDKVWLDSDKNGVQDPGEEGVGGVTVTLYDNLGNVVATTITDGYGMYLFENVKPGTYTINFSLPIDYVFTGKDLGGDENTDSDASPITGTTASFTLTAGQDKLDVDAGVYFTEDATASLGNYYWYDDNGNGVQDPTERGVSNMSVTLYDGAGNVLATTLTNTTGYYEFNNLAAGSYQVGFTLPVGYTYTSVDLGGNDNTDSDVATAIGAMFGKTPVVILALGEQNLSLDAGIVATLDDKASVGDYVWNDLDQDGIQDANETGVAGVTVTLYDGNNNPIRTTTTDEFGYYIFTNVEPGEYAVGFSLPVGFIFTGMNAGTNPEMNSDVNGTGLTTVFVVAGGDALTGIDAGMYSTSLTNTAGLGDYVWYDNNDNGIQDGTESGVSGIIVTLLDGTTLLPLATTTTNADGFYQFNNLAAGDYVVRFSNLPEGKSFTLANQGGDDNTDSDVTAAGYSQVVTLVANTFDPSIDAGIRSQATTSGRASLGNYVWYDNNQNGIQDAGEQGVEGVRVILTNITSGAKDTVWTTTTGYYIFNNLNAGQYQVNFGQLPVSYTFSAANVGTTTDESDSDANTVTGTTTIISLADGESNMSVDAGIFNPLNTASVGDKVWSDTDQDGVQDAGELGVAGVMVTLYDAMGTPVAVTVTDDNGNYLFSGLAAGVYSVGFDLPDGFVSSPQDAGGNDATDSDLNPRTGATDPFVLSAGQQKLDVDAGIYAPLTATIGNYVWFDTNNDGIQGLTEEGVSGVTVTLYDNATNQPVGSVITDAKGYYYFTNVTPGDYYLIFSTLPNGASFTTKDATVGGGNNNNDSDVNAAGSTDVFTVMGGDVNYSFDAGIAAPKPASLFGYVWYDYQGTILPTNADGIQLAGERPVTGVTVKLYDNAGNLVSTTVTDRKGEYFFQNLIPGTYEVRFVKPLGTKYTLQDQGGNDMIDSDVNPATQSGGSYTVAAGENKEGADAGFIPPASLTGITFKDGCANIANTANGIEDNNGGVCNDTRLGGVTVLLLDAAGTVLRTARTLDNGIYLFRNLDTDVDYRVAFESNPLGCATCDFTDFNAVQGNDTTDSDANPATVMTNATKVYAMTDLVPSLLPLELRPDIDAGYRLAGSTFPVEILSFTATLEGNDGLLKWITAQELNSSHYDIERSIDEGTTFEFIGSVAAAGNSTVEVDYNYSDYNVVSIAKNKIFYRLKVVDIDNSYKYSNVVELNLNGEQGLYVNAYPNPAKDVLYVDYQLYGGQAAEIKVVNQLGQILYTQPIQGSDKAQQLFLDLRDWSVGIYYIHVSTEDKSVTKKFVKE